MIDIKVKSSSTEQYAPIEDYAIVTYDLVELTEYSLKIQIYFQRPEKITQSLIDPDTLELSFKFGHIFIDS